MLKRYIFAAGALLVATLATSEPASAAHRVSYSHRSYVAAHRVRPVLRRALVTRSRFANRTFATRGRFAYNRMATNRMAVRSNTGRWRMASRFTTARRGRVGAYRAGYRRQLARRGFGQSQMARRDTTIRNYVGSRSAYTPVSTGGASQVGGASYYSGRNRTASGGFVGSATCAHRTLPFGTKVLVTNLANSRQAVLTVNDRGPFIRGRIVDVSTGAAGVLGMLHSGTAPVRVTVVGGGSG